MNPLLTDFSHILAQFYTALGKIIWYNLYLVKLYGTIWVNTVSPPQLLPCSIAFAMHELKYAVITTCCRLCLACSSVGIVYRSVGGTWIGTSWFLARATTALNVRGWVMRMIGRKNSARKGWNGEAPPEWSIRAIELSFFESKEEVWPGRHQSVILESERKGNTQDHKHWHVWNVPARVKVTERLGGRGQGNNFVA